MHRIFVSEDNSYIIMERKGEVTRQTAMEQNIEAHRLGRELGIRKYLVDATHARNVETILGNYKFSYEDMTCNPEIDSNAIIAAVVSPDDHSHDFVETVLRNNGVNVTYFRDKDCAIEYLKAK